MKNTFLVALALLLSQTAQAQHCEVSNKTVEVVHGWLYSPLEISFEAIIQVHIIPALKADGCIASKLQGSEFRVLAERLAHDVLQNKHNVREVIQEFLAE
jgi:hypothetical protein